jgi:Leucine-rich repeat (LRR) protein
MEGEQRTALMALAEILRDSGSASMAQVVVGPRMEPRMAATVLMEGVLSKQSSGTVKRWQPRHFSLDSNGLLKYCTIDAAKRVDPKLKTVVDLDEMTKCSLAAHPDGHEIVIHPIGYVMRARDQSVARQWQKTLLRAHKKKQGTTGNEPCVEDAQATVAPPPLVARRGSMSRSRRRSTKKILLPGIDTIDHHGNSCDIKALAISIPPGAAPSITACDLSSCGLTSSCALHLAPLIERLPFLASLNLSHNRLHQGSAQVVLANAIGSSPSLQWLGLAHNMLDCRHLVVLTAALMKECRLTHIDLSGNLFAEKKEWQLAGVRQLSTVFAQGVATKGLSVNTCNCGIGGEAGALLADWASGDDAGKLVSLNRIPVGDLLCDSLRELKLVGMSLGPAECWILAPFLRTTTCLASLDLAENQLMRGADTSGVSALSEAIVHNPSCPLRCVVLAEQAIDPSLYLDGTAAGVVDWWALVLGYAAEDHILVAKFVQLSDGRARRLHSCVLDNSSSKSNGRDILTHPVAHTDGTEAVLLSLQPCTLTTLSISHSALNAKCFMLLAAICASPSLISLELSACKLLDSDHLQASVEKMISSLRYGTLTALHLSITRLESIETLVPYLRSTAVLNRLSLKTMGTGPAQEEEDQGVETPSPRAGGGDPPQDAPACSSVISRAWGALEANMSRSIETLDLSSNYLGLDGLSRLTAWLGAEECSLRKLSLAASGLLLELLPVSSFADSGSEWEEEEDDKKTGKLERRKAAVFGCFCDVLQRDSLLYHLDLARNALRPRHMRAIFRALCRGGCSGVRSLNLAGNCMGTKGASLCVTSLTQSALQYIDLSANRIGESSKYVNAPNQYHTLTLASIGFVTSPRVRSSKQTNLRTGTSGLASQNSTSEHDNGRVEWQSRVCRWQLPRSDEDRYVGTAARTAGG